MNMIFVRIENLGTSCPSCNTVHEAPQNENEDIECVCGMRFRRVIYVQENYSSSDGEKGWPSFRVSQQRCLKWKIVDSPGDDLRLFRRVRIIERPKIADSSMLPFSTSRVLRSPSALLQEGDPKTEQITIQYPVGGCVISGNKRWVHQSLKRHRAALHSISMLVCRPNNCNAKQKGS